MRQRTREDVGVFFWAEGCAPGSAIPFRRATNGAGRPVDEICMEELVALASEVLSTGKTGDPAVAAMARELGVKRSVEAVRSRLGGREILGLTLPDPDLRFNAETGHYAYGDIDWSEFKRILAGDGPCNAQRLAYRVTAHEDGAWVREAAMAYADKHAVRSEGAA